MHKKFFIPSIAIVAGLTLIGAGCTATTTKTIDTDSSVTAPATTTVEGESESETAVDTVPVTYYYVCEPHVALGMKGKIVVE